MYTCTNVHFYFIIYIMSKEIDPITNEFWVPRSLEVIKDQPEEEQDLQRANVIRNGIQQLAVHLKLPNTKLTPVTDPDSYSIYWKFKRSSNGVLLPEEENDELAGFRKPAARITFTDIGPKKILSGLRRGMPIVPTVTAGKIAVEGCSYVPELDETVRFTDVPEVDISLSSSGFEGMNPEQFSEASTKVINVANTANLELQPPQS